MRLLIFTDLDGTLLDHDGYGHADAETALGRIRDGGIPLVFVTSKTRPEVEALQADMGIEEPFVVENGGGIFFPPRFDALRIHDAEPAEHGRVVVLGRRYEAIRAFVEDVGKPLGVRGFGDRTVEQIARETGLQPEAAAFARRREFTEPFTLADEGRLPELTAAAERAGLAIVRGGRFRHLIDAGQDKAVAVRRVRAVFEANPGDATGDLVTLGLGDSPNDFAMLGAVDIPVIVPNPAAATVIAERPGAAGWNLAVHAVLDRLGRTTTH